jgi:C_GCAxxG_C_C family probable redox protein
MLLNQNGVFKMFINTVLKYRNMDLYDLSCSETILVAANDYYKLDLSQDAIHMMAPFSSGMMVEETCGALTGAIAVLGILFTVERSHTSPLLKKLVQEFIDRFNKKTSINNCAKLKILYQTEEKGCRDIVVWAGQILEDIISREKLQAKHGRMD